MDYGEIEYSVEDAVLTVALNRPDQLNAVTDSMIEELVDAFRRADADPAVRAVVVTGRGRAFCAGADLSAGGSRFDPEARGGARHMADHRDGGGRVGLAVHACRKPVIAAVNGAAVGFGATFTLPMDVRLASTNARFGFVISRRGVVPEGCSTWFLPRVVGISQALEWIATGRVFGAEEAFAGGLVRSLHEPEALLAAAYAIAREIAEGTSVVSVALAREMLWRGLAETDPMPAHLRESRLMWHTGRSADAREGVESFLEKRSPRFPLDLGQDYPAQLL
jgi:enoyl-CoA hydratase/carnithine racemase